MAATDPIKISFELNSKELEAEFKRIVSGAKNPDEAIAALQERFKQMNAAQLLGAKGMEDVVSAMAKVGEAAKQVKVDDFILAKADLEEKKRMIKELEAQIKELQKLASEMAPGVAQYDILAEVSSAESKLKRYSEEIGAMANRVDEMKSSHEQLSTTIRKVKNEMAAMQAAGKGNSKEYQELSKRAVEYQQALDKVNNEVKFLSRGGLQGMVQGLGALAGGFSAAQGAVGLFAGENENLQEIMVKVQSLMAITIGLQQISETLDKSSAFNTKFLTQTKMALARANTYVATTFKISNTAAKALLGTFSLGLMVAIPVVINLLQKMANASSDTAKKQKAITDASADQVAEMLVNYKLLQKQWENTSGTLKDQQRFVDQNQEAFKKLGVSVNDVNDAQSILVDNSDDFLKALMNQAKAAAAMQIATEKMKESLVVSDKEKELGENLRGGWWDKAKGGASILRNMVGAPLGMGSYETSQGLEKESEDYLKMYQKFVDEANSIFDDLGIDSGNQDKQKEAQKQTLQDLIADREEAWRQYYQYEAEFGKQAAARQFAGIRAEADSFFDWLTNQKGSFADILTGGGTLTGEQRKDFEAVTSKLAELSGERSGFENFTRGIEDAIEQTPILVDQLALLDAEIEKLQADSRNVDNGKLSFLMGRRDNVQDELKKLADEFIQAHQSIEQQKTEITQKFAAIRREIEAREMDSSERDRLMQEVERAQQVELDKLKEVEEEKEEIFTDTLRNITALTKRELGYRIQALEEYFEAAKAGLTEEEEMAVRSEIERAKALRKMGDFTSREIQLLQEKERILSEIAKIEKGSDAERQAKQSLEEIDKQLGEITIQRTKEVSDYAAVVASGFYDISAAIEESNEGLGQMLRALGEVANVLSSSISAAAAFGSGDMAGGILGSFSALGGFMSMVFGGSERRRRQREEQKRYEVEAFHAGLDYNKMLRDRLMLNAQINEYYRSRVSIIKDELAAAEQNLLGIINDQRNVVAQLLDSMTKIPLSFQTGWGPSTVDVNIGHLLGLTGANSVEEFMSNFEHYMELLASMNAENPFTGWAATFYQDLLDLVDEAGGLEAFMEQWEKEWKDLITGTTTQSIANSIIEGLKQGKRSFEDFGDDIEGILRNAILAGINAKLMDGMVQPLQDFIFDALEDGPLTAEDVDAIRDMWNQLVGDALDIFDALDQTGLDLFGSQDLNSLQGAYKAASQESIDLLSGNTAALRLSVIEGNSIFQSGFSSMLQAMSSQLEIQMNIENNTLTIAQNTQSINLKLSQIMLQGTESTFSGTGLNP